MVYSLWEGYVLNFSGGLHQNSQARKRACDVYCNRGGTMPGLTKYIFVATFFFSYSPMTISSIFLLRMPGAFFTLHW